MEFHVMKSTVFFFCASEAGGGKIYMGLLVKLLVPHLQEDSSEFMSSNMVHFLTFSLVCTNI